ncbi:MAG: peptidoglycan DD-metalloendopeptidase family protein [Alphaproteobacteria bacterium]|nr:peptidoglycan DD-metalloendopeptidase family protein [Alphaproteobacteria bacterium]
MTATPLDPESRPRTPLYPDDDFFTLGAPVGPDQPNRREDVVKVETILGNTGLHDLAATNGPLGYWGERQEKSVRDWQTQNGLKVDGVLNPGGPTITSLGKKAGPLLNGFKPPTLAEIDDHHQRLYQGEPGTLNLRPARLSLPAPDHKLDLDEQTLAFNADSARALTRSTNDGDIPRIYGDFAKQAGPDSHATLMDLAEQMDTHVGRDRTDQVMHGILKDLPPEQTRALLGGDMPSPRPLGVRNSDLPDDSAVPLFKAAQPMQMALAEGATAGDGAPAPAPSTSPPQQPTNVRSPVLNPTQREDDQGGGHFGANREGGRKHKGLDIEAAPGTEVVAPTGGKIIGVGNAYKDPTKFGGEFKSVKVEGDDGRVYTMRYVSPNDKEGKQLAPLPGTRVEAGQVIGSVQDRARHSRGMDNHVHVEIRDKDKKTHIDPGPVFNPAPPRRRQN